MAPRAGCARGAAPGRRTGVGLCGRSPGRRPNRLAQLLSGVLLALRFLALPLHARLLVMLASASLGEDSALLDLLVEAAQCAFERLVLTHSDFCQSRFTSSGRGLDLGVVLAANSARRVSGVREAHPFRAGGA